MKNNKKYRNFNVRLSNQLTEEFRIVCENMDSDKSKEVRKLIRDFVEKNKEEYLYLSKR